MTKKERAATPPSAIERGLRQKFILVAMGAVTIVLVGIVGGINLANYLAISNTADSKLALIAKNDGYYPGTEDLWFEDEGNLQGDSAGDSNGSSGNGSNGDSANAGASSNTANGTDSSILLNEDGTSASATDGASSSDAAGSDSSSNVREIEVVLSTVKRASKRFNGPMTLDKVLNAEEPYSIRYFTVTVNSDGVVLDVDTSFTASVSESDATAYAAKVYRKNARKTNGFYGSYRYLCVSMSEVDVSSDNTMCIFLDCSREMSNFQSFLTASIAIGVLGWLAVLVLVVVLSRFAIKPVVESYEKQKRFITDASHEIKTPLAVIDAAIQVQEIESGESEWTQSIHDQVARLTALTERLVFLARMDEGAAGFTKADVDLSELVDKTSEPFSSVALSRGKRLSRSIASGLTCKGDKAALAQVVELLLDNATRYASDGSVIELALAAGEHGGACLAVTNAVDDLPSIDLDRLFDRFYRADTSRNSKTGGSGVGLSVAKAIVEAHGGTIKATGAGDQITFTVRF